MVHARLLALVALVAGLSLFACAGTTGETPQTDAGFPPQADAGATLTKAELRSAVRDAFVAELRWSRLYSVSALAGGDDASAAFSRLRRAEDAVAAALMQFYGPEKEAALASVLERRATALSTVVAHEGGRVVPTLSGRDQLYANATDVVQFFTDISLYAWFDLATKLRRQVDAILDGIDARVQGDELRAVRDFDAAQQRTLELADALSDGLAKLFSSRLALSSSAPGSEDFRLELHVALEDHAFWMRSWMIDYLSHRSAQAALDRATQSSFDVANALTSRYGTVVGNAFQLAIHNDTTDAVAYVFASTTGDGATIDGILQRWTADAEALAQLLVSTFRGLDSATVSTYTGANVTNQRTMIQARFAGDWSADVAAYDRVVTNLDALGDAVADVVAQPAVH